jgi:hypothetical protein
MEGSRAGLALRLYCAGSLNMGGCEIREPWHRCVFVIDLDHAANILDQLETTMILSGLEIGEHVLGRDVKVFDR